ncbi:MAG: ElyC/SanA/YdcF family protein [Kiritimatiellia bacterium]
MKALRNKIPVYVRVLAMLSFAVAVISGPMASRLQMRTQKPQHAQHMDAIYLVCGARAQARRLRTMHAWLKAQPQSDNIQIWIGNDTQNSLWSRKHQRNLTRAEWAYEYASTHFATHKIQILPGTFSNTDGEMLALARYVADRPEIRKVAFVTCGFHARRSLARFSKHASGNIAVSVIPVIPHWENRAPWIVTAEWLKILRDRLRLSQHPWLSRQS